MKIIDDVLDGIHTIAVSGHVRPDGDCTGSVLALYNYLVSNFPDIHVDMFLETPPERFSFLKNYSKINSSFYSPIEASYDLMICLDSSNEERLGMAGSFMKEAGHVICMDHHISNTGYADENYIFPDSSSACEVLYGFLDRKKIDKDIAECLYVGIATDTGCFKYSCTSAQTMRIAAQLMEYGLDTNKLVDESFFQRNLTETHILGYALQNSVALYDGKVIYSCISREIMDQTGACAKDMDGISSQLRLVKGVVCAVLIYEEEECKCKASFRSDDPFDVNELAGFFGGGGHVRAAGCNIRGEIKTCLEAVLSKIDERKELLYL